MARILCCVIALLAFASLTSARPSASVIPAVAQPSSHFDAKAATDAWLATVPADKRAKSDAYFEGGYWLILWDFLYEAAVLVLLFSTGISARMRDVAARITRVRFFQAVIYFVEFTIITYVLSFPLTVYEGFFREHQYGLATQNFGGWFRDQAVGLAISAVIGAIAVAILFAVVRRLPRTWHIWGTVVAIAFLIFTIVLAPVFVEPLFNTYKPLTDLTIKNEVLSLAHANGIPARDVYEVDASRQSNRVSANVAGLFGTERIALNDNLLNRCSPHAILSVMGHEMGHYVLHHIYIDVLFFSLTTIIAFAILRRSLDYALARWGTRWRITAIDDVAVLPVAALILSIMGFLFTPFANTFTRTQEFEADLYGINAARQPDGEAEVDLLLGEYRKLDPGQLEEFIFFDHPSGRRRIHAAMQWKAENLCLFDASLPCPSQPNNGKSDNSKPVPAT